MTPRLLLPALLILAAACSEGAEPAASPSPSTTAPTTAAPSTPAPTASPTYLAFGAAWYFRSPSGNIGCAIETTAAACDIVEKTWAPPSKPSSCELDWGQNIAVVTNPKPEARFGCVGDTVFNAEAPALAFGEKLTHNGFACESRQDGIRCVHVASGRGFLLGRAKYDLF